jgi:hypothetical protein
VAADVEVAELVYPVGNRVQQLTALAQAVDAAAKALLLALRIETAAKETSLNLSGSPLICPVPRQSFNS